MVVSGSYYDLLYHYYRVQLKSNNDLVTAIMPALAASDPRLTMFPKTAADRKLSRVL